MKHFSIKFSKYTTYDAPKGTPNRGVRVLSQPIHITEDDFVAAYRYAALRVTGMRDADPVNVYEIAAVVASPDTTCNVAIELGTMFELSDEETVMVDDGVAA